ncbi:MAG: hypothetical protein DBY09_00150 [Selenomonadales bacterium]|nr:MAG: hypothetical protein DBY09_00150 [Selenomonadales bacterium]
MRRAAIILNKRFPHFSGKNSRPWALNSSRRALSLKSGSPAVNYKKAPIITPQKGKSFAIPLA